jgi:hypothetical protein
MTPPAIQPTVTAAASNLNEVVARVVAATAFADRVRCDRRAVMSGAASMLRHTAKVVKDPVLATTLLHHARELTHCVEGDR